MLFLDFLSEHWNYYYSRRAFRDALLQVAKKELRSMQEGLQPTSESVKQAYLLRMGRVRPIRRADGGAPQQRIEWAGPVECDIASELFGMRIRLWTALPNDRQSYWLNNEFVPQLLAGSVDPRTSIFKWELVQTGMAHFQYFQPWIGDRDPIPQTGASVMQTPQSPPRSPSSPRWAGQVNEYEAGAMEKIRALIARGLRYTWGEFKLWFELNFTIRGVAARASALHLFFAAYMYLNQEAEAEAPAAAAPAQLSPFTPFMQGPNMGRSVVDEVFSKHARSAPSRVVVQQRPC